MAKGRIWEVDLLRVVAMVLMIVFHFVYDLNVFAGVDVSYTSGPWMWVGRMAGLLFIFVSGISSGFGSKPVRRGLQVFGFGMLITVVTYFFLGDIYIRFGILHLLGICMMLSPWFFKMPKLVLAAGAGAVLILWQQVTDLAPSTSVFLPLGITYPGFSSADYYPLIPYLAVFLMGTVVYKLYYYKKQSLFNFSLEHPVITQVSKSSLTIYILHQPMLLAGIYMAQML